MFNGQPLDVERLRDDPAYRRAYEDWLDLSENLGRDPREARRTDLLFLAGCVMGLAILAAVAWWVLS